MHLKENVDLNPWLSTLKIAGYKTIPAQNMSGFAETKIKLH